jgi:hypothetical protein
MKTTIFILAFIAIGSAAIGQEIPDSNYAIYAGEKFFFIMAAPDGWNLALEEAQASGYSAAFYPSESEYLSAKQIIYIWIFKKDSLTYNEFVSADSSNYLLRDDSIAFIAGDSMHINDSIMIKILDFRDPGGYSMLAKVAYIDMISEVVVYELNIANREGFIEAENKFIRALRKFSILTKGDED